MELVRSIRDFPDKGQIMFENMMGCFGSCTLRDNPHPVNGSVRLEGAQEALEKSAKKNPVLFREQDFWGTQFKKYTT